MDTPVAPSLQSAVAELIGRSTFELGDVRRESLPYDAFLAHRTVNRLRGAADAGDVRVSWSLIEKTTEGPGTASPYLVDNGRRELAAYASGMLEELGTSVRAPRALGSLEEPDGRITLWLEEVHHQGPRPLDAGTLLAAARDLGGLAGRWLERVPDHPWLFTGWIDRHAQPQAVENGLATLVRSSSCLPGRLANRLDEAQRLVRAQPRLRGILEALPQTLCHHDAVGANVSRADGQTVLIDWESVGPGPVGADLASLLFSSVRRGDVSAVLVCSVLDDAVEAYVEGLRPWTDAVDVALVRRALDAAIALRWKLAVDVVAALHRGEPIVRGSALDEPPDTAMEELTVLVEVLLAAARRALGA